MRAESRGLAGRSAMLLPAARNRKDRCACRLLLALEIAFDDRAQPIAQPDQAGIPASAAAPDHRMRQRRKRKRNVPALQPVGAQRLVHRNRRQGRQQIGPGQDRCDRARSSAPIRRSSAPGPRRTRQHRPGSPGVADPHHQMRRSAPRSPHSNPETPDARARPKQRQPSAPTASPVTPWGKRNSDGTIAMSIRPSATSSKVGSRGAVHSTATPGASRPSRVIRLGEQRQHEIGRRQPEHAARTRGIENMLRRQHALDAARAWGAPARSDRARARSAASARPPLISRGSPNCSRSRDSEWLTADCVRPSRSAARVTLRSVIKTSNTTKQVEVEMA